MKTKLFFILDHKCLSQLFLLHLNTGAYLCSGSTAIINSLLFRALPINATVSHFEVLDFNPLLSDIHCAVALTLKYKCSNPRNVDLDKDYTTNQDN